MVLKNFILKYKRIFSISKTQQRFKSEKYNAFTEEIRKITLSSNDDKRMQSIDLIEPCTYATSKDLVSDEENIKCNNITIQKIINFNDVVKENIREQYKLTPYS